MSMSGTSTSTIAYYLALIGGILMIILGLLGLIVDFGGFLFRWGFGFAYGSIIILVMGIIAVIGATSVNTLAWTIVLIVVGLVGGGLGGLLVALGGIFGLNVLTKKT